MRIVNILENNRELKHLSVEIPLPHMQTNKYKPRALNFWRPLTKIESIVCTVCSMMLQKVQHEVLWYVNRGHFKSPSVEIMDRNEPQLYYIFQYISVIKFSFSSRYCKRKIKSNNKIDKKTLLACYSKSNVS